MGKSEGTKNQTRFLVNRHTIAQYFRTKKTMWLIGLTAFFVPSMAVGAWYAGNGTGGETMQTNQMQNSDAKADSSGATASSKAGNAEAHATANAQGAKSKASTNSSDEVKAEITVNGQKIPVPKSGTYHHEVHSSTNGTQPTQVDISVNSSQNSNSGQNFGSHSTHIHSHSSTNSNSNNSSTSSFHSFSTSP